MGRLIDADVLEKIIKMEHCMVINGHLAIRKPSGIYKPLLDEIPTAYDVEKVVAELDKQTNLHNISESSDYWTWVSAMDKAIGIVRKGGSK